MVKIWEPENRYNIWLEIELLAAEAQAELGVVPTDAVRVCRAKAAFNIQRIEEIETEVKHDVIAFLTSVNEHIGAEGRYLHQGMTSSDVLDTCLAVQLKQAGELLIEGLRKVLSAIKKQAMEHKLTPTIGRSHGIHAEPTTFGLKLAGFYAEFERNKKRLEHAIEDVATAKLSGAVGNFSNISPRVEEYVAEKLGLKPEPVATQVIPRDRHANYFATLGVIASSIERIAVEIRHLQRSEVLEAEEFFSKGQKGSSAMPHKRNPVLSENLTGLARIVRGFVNPALENVALWHERDISHSSVERMIAPDATVTLDFALHRLAGLVENLVVYPDNMRSNLDKLGGLHFSQSVLLALTQRGVSREDSYRYVQRNAMQVWESVGGDLEDFRILLQNDADVSKALSSTEIDEIFDENRFYANIEYIFKRVFK
jgi:adenylosuccinate lyase